MDILRLFESAENVETYETGRTVFEAGDEAHHMYVVLSGVVELQRDGITLNLVGPGSLLGEMALIGDHRRSATAIARSDLRLAPVNERRFTFLVQQTPFFALHVMRVLADRIRQKEAAYP